MTVNQLRQALRTYTTRWSCRLVAFGWLCAQIPLLDFTHRSRGALAEELLAVMSLPLMANLLLGAMVGAMLKVQFADPRARLMPRFAVPHLVVAGAIIATAIGIQTALAPGWAGIGGQAAMISVAFLAIVAAAWTFYSMNALGSILLMFLPFLVMLIPRYVAKLLQIVIDNPSLSVGLGYVGLVALGALAVLVWTLSEERPEYSRRLPFRWDFSSGAAARMWQRREAEAIQRAPRQGWLLDLQFGFLLRRGAAAGPWRRVVLRQLGGGFSILNGVIIMFMVMLAIMLPTQMLTRKPGGEANFIVLTFMPMQMALGMLGGMWLRRWPLLARESLRPLARREFVRDMARSLACDLAAPLTAHLTVIVLFLQLLPPQGRLSGFLLPWLALTVAQYIVAGCLMFWVVSYRQFLGLLIGVMTICGLSAASAHLVLFGPAGFWSPVTVTAAVVGTAITAVLMYRTAFRRWCSIDMA